MSNYKDEGWLAEKAEKHEIDIDMILDWLGTRVSPARREAAIWDFHNGVVHMEASNDLVTMVRRFRNCITPNPVALTWLLAKRDAERSKA